MRAKSDTATALYQPATTSGLLPGPRVPVVARPERYGNEQRQTRAGSPWQTFEPGFDPGHEGSCLSGRAQSKSLAALQAYVGRESPAEELLSGDAPWAPAAIASPRWAELLARSLAAPGRKWPEEILECAGTVRARRQGDVPWPASDVASDPDAPRSVPDPLNTLFAAPVRSDVADLPPYRPNFAYPAYWAEEPDDIPSDDISGLKMPHQVLAIAPVEFDLRSLPAWRPHVVLDDMEDDVE